MYDEAHLVPLYWYGRLAPMVSALKGYDLVPNFIANQDLTTV